MKSTSFGIKEYINLTNRKKHTMTNIINVANKYDDPVVWSFLAKRDLTEDDIRNIVPATFNSIRYFKKILIMKLDSGTVKTTISKLSRSELSRIYYNLLEHISDECFISLVGNPRHPPDLHDNIPNNLLTAKVAKHWIDIQPHVYYYLFPPILKENIEIAKYAAIAMGNKCNFLMFPSSLQNNKEMVYFIMDRYGPKDIYHKDLLI
jgi:hypothetical protein